MREAMSSAALRPVTEVELLHQLQSSRAFRVQNTRSVPRPSTILHPLPHALSFSRMAIAAIGGHGMEARLEL